MIEFAERSLGGTMDEADSQNGGMATSSKKGKSLEIIEEADNNFQAKE